jgi:flagellar motor component MotA
MNKKTETLIITLSICISIILIIICLKTMLPEHFSISSFLVVYSSLMGAFFIGYGMSIFGIDLYKIINREKNE